MSIDKSYVLELSKQGFSYQEIATQSGVSRQRIHQIVKNYRNTGRKGRETKYRDMGICEICKKQTAILLHHKDLNNSNDDISNLQRLCSVCHLKQHTLKMVYEDMTEEDKASIIKDYAVYSKDAITVKKISEKYNITQATIYRIVKEYK